MKMYDNPFYGKLTGINQGGNIYTLHLNGELLIADQDFGPVEYQRDKLIKSLDLKMQGGIYTNDNGDILKFDCSWSDSLTSLRMIIR